MKVGNLTKYVLRNKVNLGDIFDLYKIIYLLNNSDLKETYGSEKTSWILENMNY